jgi:hypothetical protein
MVNYNHSFTLIALTRDRDSGRIIIDKDGEPRVDYTLSKYDAKSLLAGGAFVIPRFSSSITFYHIDFTCHE